VRARLVVLLVFVVGAATASADTESEPRGSGDSAELPGCREVLRGLGVDFARAHRRGIADGVEIRRPISGVTYHTHGDQALVIDCSLAVSLALAAPYFAAQGLTQIHYSSAHDRRFIRGTRRLSRHSFGLAIDLNSFAGDSVGALTVRDDYEQGLGDSVDCVGRPLTSGGLILRRLVCQLSGSELFRIVLDPDFDADHFHHLHVEALPWDDRTDHDLLSERLRSRR
jgi:hypothetical protein